MKKLHQLYDGQSKTVFATDDPNAVILAFKDEAVCYGGLKRSHVDGKGAMCNRISNYLMRLVEKNGIPTHYLQEVSERQTLVRKVRLLPFAVICRYVSAGSLSSRLGIPDGTQLRERIIEFHYRSGEQGDQLVNEYHISAMGWASRPVLAEITAMAEKISDILQETFRSCGVELIDCGLEFGFTVDGKLVLGDEISPDTCRLWDASTHEKLDKDRFRLDMEDVGEAYQEIGRRLLDQ